MTTLPARDIERRHFRQPTILRFQRFQHDAAAMLRSAAEYY